MKNIFLVAFVISFFTVLTVSLIFFAQGKKVTPTGEIVSTSVIKIDSIPEKVDVSLNGGDVKKDVERLIGLETGTFTLEVTKAGYSTWKKDVDLKEGEVKVVNAMIYPLNPDTEKITEVSNVLAFTKSIDGTYIVYAQDEDDEIHFYKFKTTSDLLGLASQDAPEEFFKIKKSKLGTNFVLEIAPDNKSLLVKSDDNSFAYVLHLQEGSKEINLENILGFVPKKVLWFNDSNNLLVENEGLLFTYNFIEENQKIIAYEPNNNPIYVISKNVIYYRKVEDGSEFIYKFDGSNSTPVSFEGLDLDKSHIENFYIAADSPNVLIVELKDSYIYIDFKESFIDFIDSKYDLVAVDSFGDKILLKLEDSYYVYEINYSGKITSSIRKSIIKVDNDSFGFNYWSNILIKSSSSELIFSDVDGYNAHTFIKDGSLLEDYYSFDKNDEYFYIMMKPEDKDSFGFYKIKLKD